MKRPVILIALLIVVAVAVTFRHTLINVVHLMMGKEKAHKTVADRLGQYGEQARARLVPYFSKAQVAYPPASAVLVGIKEEKRLELYARAVEGGFKFVRSWPILAASGELGPKLKEGDCQVPEGIYPIELLNPNSSYHLSLRVGYPNEFDRAQAKREGRMNLGGDIMIHGSNVSIGCLAMGDEAAEDLFVLGADTGVTRMTAILTPVDFRKGRTIPQGAKLPAWTDDLYKQIREQLGTVPTP